MVILTDLVSNTGRIPLVLRSRRLPPATPPASIQRDTIGPWFGREDPFWPPAVHPLWPERPRQPAAPSGSAPRYSSRPTTPASLRGSTAASATAPRIARIPPPPTPRATAKSKKHSHPKTS